MAESCFKKKIGIPVAVVKIVFTVGSMLVGLWQGLLQFQNLPAGMGEGPERTGMIIGFIIGAGFVLVLRLALLGLYIAALVRANRVLSQ